VQLSASTRLPEAARLRLARRQTHTQTLITSLLLVAVAVLNAAAVAALAAC
jgi:hypothetical protein